MNKPESIESETPAAVAGAAYSALVWTENLPTEGGPYWHCHYLPPGDKPKVTHISMNFESAMMLCRDGSWCQAKEIGGWWAGPILEPQMPNDPSSATRLSGKEQ